MAEQKKKKKKNSTVFIVIIIICLGVMAFAAYKLITLQLEYKEGRDEYSELQQYTVRRNPEPVPTATPEPEVTPETKEDEKEEAKEQKKFDPIIPHMKCPIDVDFAPLKEINEDIIGWLYVGAVDISYPIVQGPDNDYYLHKTFMGTDNFAGSIFMESSNKKDFSDPHTILYGHNMLDQSMFGKLKLLTDSEMYKKDPYIWVLTPEHTYRYSMFSLHRVSYDGSVYTLFSGPSELVTKYIEECAADSLVPFELTEFDEKSKVLTLSTCTSSDTERYAAQAIRDQVD